MNFSASHYFIIVRWYTYTTANETEKNCFHSRRNNNFYITIAIICNSIYQASISILLFLMCSFCYRT